MTIRGLVQSAELVENPPGSETIEMVVRAQGVGAGQPRRFVVPYDLLLADEALDPDLVVGRPFLVEVEEESPGRWRALRIKVAGGRLLRPEDSQ